MTEFERKIAEVLSRTKVLSEPLKTGFKTELERKLAEAFTLCNTKKEEDNGR